MTTHSTPAHSTAASATGATGQGWGSPAGGSQPVAPTFDLGRGHLPWLTVRFTSPGATAGPTSPAHPEQPTHTSCAVHRTTGSGASCAREHRRGRVATETRGRGGH